jgi:TRAP-type C4-dicarboxylate transport system permease small subunit
MALHATNGLITLTQSKTNIGARWSRTLAFRMLFRQLIFPFGSTLIVFFERQQQQEQAYQRYLRTVHQSLQKHTIKVTNA